MAEGKKSFIVYTSWKSWLDTLSDSQKGQWLAWMMDYTNDLNPEYPSDQVVKMACIMVQDVLKRDLKKYDDKVKSIKVAREKRKQKYEINTDFNKNNIEKEKNNTETKIETSVISNSNHTEITSVNVNVNDNVNVNVSSKDDVYINNTLEQNALAETARREALFNKFWENYPKKKNKDKCKKWFMNKNRKVDEALVDEMINAILIQSTSEQWQKSNGQFIPYPYTWLNGGGWKDEIDTDVNDNVIPNGGFEEL